MDANYEIMTAKQVQNGNDQLFINGKTTAEYGKYGSIQCLGEY